MALFLHFLNREAYRAAQREFSLSVAEDVLRVLCIARSDELYTNYANILESGALGDARTTSILREMLRCSQVLIEAERPTLDEFLETRTARYGFDSTRYPMYFSGDSVPAEALRAQRIRSVSLTDHIANEIVSLDRRERTPADVGIAPFDALSVSSVISRLSCVIRKRGDRAITRSLFHSVIPTAVHANAASRLISSSYIKRHTVDLSADIVTGIEHLLVFDHLGSGEWNADYPLLRILLCHSGFRPALSSTKETDARIAALRGTYPHVAFSRELTHLCRVLRRRYERDAAQFRSTVARQLTLIAEARAFLDMATGPFEEATQHLRRVASNLRRLDGQFAIAYEQETRSMSRNCVLIVTATKVETQALLGSCAELAKLLPTHITRERLVAHDFGDLNGSRVLHVQCEAGSVGPNSSQAVVEDAIREFSPDFIIMGGIAFGINSEKQRLGDVLVARTLVEYERAKIKEDQEIPRGQRIESSPKLLSMFRSAESNCVSSATMQFGVLLSGEKLVDSSRFVERLLQTECEAIGGEMEGAGLAAAAHRHQIPWIVIKAIVDWGTGKSANSGEEHQRNIARGAFDVIIGTLLTIGL